MRAVLAMSLETITVWGIEQEGWHMGALRKRRKCWVEEHVEDSKREQAAPGGIA